MVVYIIITQKNKGKSKLFIISSYDIILKLRKNNKRAIKLYEKFGFKLEGCIEDGIFDGENYINLLVYGLKI